MSKELSYDEHQAMLRKKDSGKSLNKKEQEEYDKWYGPGTGGW